MKIIFPRVVFLEDVLEKAFENRINMQFVFCFI